MDEMRNIQVGDKTIYTAHKLRVVNGIHGHGTTTREYKMKPKPEQCRGCRDDFYNPGCWMFEGAKVVDKVGYTSIHIPCGPDGIMRKTLSCWHSVRK